MATTATSLACSCPTSFRSPAPTSQRPPERLGNAHACLVYYPERGQGWSPRFAHGSFCLAFMSGQIALSKSRTFPFSPCTAHIILHMLASLFSIFSGADDLSEASAQLFWHAPLLFSAPLGVHVWGVSVSVSSHLHARGSACTSFDDGMGLRPTSTGQNMCLR